MLLRNDTGETISIRSGQPGNREMIAIAPGATSPNVDVMKGDTKVTAYLHAGALTEVDADGKPVTRAASAPAAAKQTERAPKTRATEKPETQK